MTSRPLHAHVAAAGPQLLTHLAAALDGTGPALLVVSPDLPAARVRAVLEAMRPAAAHTPDGLRRLPGAVGVDPEVAAVVATSGSTGPPKGVELTAAALKHSARASLDRLGARPGEPWLCALPADHIAGLQVLVRCLLAGAAPVFQRRLDLDAALAAGARHASLVPTQLHRLTEAGADLSGLASIVVGGAAAPPALLQRARALGATLTTTYGMTETCGGCVYDGTPLDGVRVAVHTGAPADPPTELTPRAPDTPLGTVLLGGPVLFSGYRLRPDLTAAHRDGPWLRTADLGALQAGRLAVAGRSDDVITTGGRKVAAGQVAAALAAHPRVAEVAVVGRPDPEWGQRVTAVVVPRGPPPTLTELREHTAATLPRYAAPRELELRDALPLLPSGKPDLAALRRTPRPA
ncbi:AMP-binding protein [Allonocardiopsis opalescens]|uniref:O-succinylbenzoic acid--CoA ligase n=1 Tax=Allonocardiopsis opalescens TaxID=1144618 RepID=A0A2T0Q4P6_9ACTN|nr:AMP-binding protein [Allonocardiopsis opalescens]PRX98776.1 O-succinylbenzoic acid--CoA ligase [Allonocardiopsis opalescens]